jgi:hypothetical protein
MFHVQLRTEVYANGRLRLTNPLIEREIVRSGLEFVSVYPRVQLSENRAQSNDSTEIFHQLSLLFKV